MPMPYRKLICALYVLLCLAPGISSGQKRFDFDPRCREAYTRIMMMQIKAGKELLNEEKQANPDNLIPAFLDNYVDMFVLFFHEDRSEYDAREGDRDRHISLMKRGPKSSPYYLFTQAMIYAQWGIIKFKYEENLSAMWDFRRAYLLIRQNHAKFPSFSPNKILLGPMEALVGTIPSSYRWITNILGFTQGSVVGGMDLLRSYVYDTTGTGRIFQLEACFYYAY